MKKFKERKLTEEELQVERDEFNSLDTEQQKTFNWLLQCDCQCMSKRCSVCANPMSRQNKLLASYA